ncbi:MULTISPECIES: hypothetical protein [unclassified Sulfurospirillum]|uniref:hypothetical protein n=1 Tax=unclassified Sulfurospirillum TaxID=2618290 RepID=UPI0004FFCC57|nr:MULTISPECIES: hypothetical protein [unclassified Sulfurospirillum]KFL33219.1 hypothetical protein JU57_12585 [Sulfurospirillum sp. SCADC]
MSYADRSIYEQKIQPTQFETKQQWIAYFVMMGIALSSHAQASTVNVQSTSNMEHIHQKSEYSSALLDYEQTMKQLEIEEIKKEIEKEVNIKIIGYWLPRIDVEKECIFFKCELDEETKKDYKKMSDIELNMYLSVKDIIDRSKYFDMVAMI